MIADMTARTQADRSEATRQALIEAAVELFAEKGFGGTATEDIVVRAGVTRGALYHHFRDKKDLFTAVYTHLADLKSRLVAEAMESDDLIAGVQAALSAYLDVCRDPVFTRICHVDAPGVLGWDEWRAASTDHGVGLITKGMQRAIDAGLIANKSADVLAHVVHGAIMEAGMLVSRDPDVDIEEVEATLMQFLVGLIETKTDV